MIQKLVCSKKCYSRINKELARATKRTTWDTDTPNEEYDGSSEAMLIDWLAVHPNHATGREIGVEFQRPKFRSSWQRK